jgi:Lytic transglycolase
MHRSRRCTHSCAVAALILLLALAAGCGKALDASSNPEAQRAGTTDAAKGAAPASPSTAAGSGRSGQPPAPERAAPAPERPATAPERARGQPPAHQRTSGEAPAGVEPAHPVPSAFQPSPGAPSDQEVAAELAQMSALERREFARRLSAAAANLAGLLPWALEPKSGVQVSVASVFTDYGRGLACGGLLGRDQLGVAHKTAPCGTRITFTYDGRSITVPVIDRGPYVAGREWDLTGATASALRFPGLGRIEWSLAR